MLNKNVIILEDEENVANVLQMIARRYGFTPICFTCVDNLIDHIEVLQEAELFITDYNLCDSTVIPVLEEIKNRNIKIYTVLNSGNQNAIKDIEKVGLLDYINEQFDKTMNYNIIFENFI